MKQSDYMLIDMAEADNPAKALETAQTGGFGLALPSKPAGMDVNSYLSVLNKTGRQLVLLRIKLDVNNDMIDAEIIKAITAAAEHQPVVEVELISSSSHDKADSPRADPRAALLIRQLAQQVIPAGLRIAMRPRVSNWLTRLDHAVRLGMRINRSEVGISFSLTDWIASDGVDMESAMHLAAPRLFHVWLGNAQQTHPTEAAQLVKLLNLHGYTGLIGAQ